MDEQLRAAGWTLFGWLTRAATCAAMVGVSACTTAELKRAPAPADAACATVAVAYCDAAPPGAGGCVGDPDAADLSARRFPADRAFPVGCTGSIVAPGVGDTAECVSVASCSCSTGANDAGDAGPAAWRCDP